MKKTIKNFIAGAILFGITSVVSAVPTATLYITDGIGPVQTVLANASGVASFNGTIGVWTLVISTGITKPSQGSATAPSMNIAIQATSSAGGSLWISYSDTAFTGVGSINATMTGHVVNGAPENVGMVVYGNTANVIGGLNANGTPLNAGSAIATIPVQGMPILASANGLLPGTYPYALTDIVSLNSQGATTASINTSFATVPDGGMTMAMLGLSLVAVEAVRRKVAQA